MTSILLSGAANGFGPASKAVAIARHVHGYERIFVGSGIAREFCERNSEFFEKIVGPEELSEDFLRHCKFGLIVMEHDIAFQLFKARVPFFFFDSLLDFWELPAGMERVANVAGAILSEQRDRIKDALYSGLSVHERKVLCHFIARRSFAQNYPGVHQRLEAMQEAGLRHTEIVGPIVRASRAPDEAERNQDGCSHTGRFSLLINLGGVRNFVIEFNKNDHYIALLEQWARRYLTETPTGSQITICCGRYTVSSENSVGYRTITTTCLAHDVFMSAIQTADIVLSAPGRTFIQEAVLMGVVPILLPEQHRSQAVNLAGLARTPFAEFCLPLSEILDGKSIPQDDKSGSQAIIECSLKILNTGDLFERFDRLLRSRIDYLRSLNSSERLRIIIEMRKLIGGQSLKEVMRGIL
ncbi:hypothetical protein [Bradyrhizobium lablabi]|uniref:hypothetical protein n=1 Tax=Bradyrhizobium lablabi TaxID=722472 RepID=UPI001BAE3E4B|nr:hypothetical protein [Bradyrhizobium lablabi]MBR0696582.1 hypothetical protein [Bradyrhizobium lablabi]